MEQAQSSESENGVRRDAQVFLAQLHGVLHRIVVEEGASPYHESKDSQEEWESLTAAYFECERFGEAQDALNSGEHDEVLLREAMAGKQGALKFGGWRSRLRAFYDSGQRLSFARRVLGWASGILESLAGIPGIGQIKELVGLLERLMSERAETLADLGPRRAAGARAGTQRRLSAPVEYSPLLAG